MLSAEIKRIGGENIAASDGRVAFSGGFDILARANIRLRTAERVCVLLGSFPAKSFTELFDNTVKLPFEEFIGRKDAFPVKGWSLKSGLFSIPDCQSIIKKAAVKRLEGVYGQSWFEETGPARQIRFSIHRDIVTIMLDTSGPPLHKRGYRADSLEAPIKETLAAGIADLARIGPRDTVYDPMCGSGTLLVEAAMRAFRIAPGLKRRFAAESWTSVPQEIWGRERESALAEVAKDAEFRAYGADIDPASENLVAQNAAKAGVGKRVTAKTLDIADFAPENETGVILCNPPYGERLLDIKAAEGLYRKMGEVFAKYKGLRCYIISPHEEFEKLFGRPADKRRKLYNGMLKCQLFMYFK
jgi:putative N6-adenine-specific DNA methylase